MRRAGANTLRFTREPSKSRRVLVGLGLVFVLVVHEARDGRPVGGRAQETAVNASVDLGRVKHEREDTLNFLDVLAALVAVVDVLRAEIPCSVRLRL